MITERQLFVYLINPEDYVFGSDPQTYVTDTSGMERQGWVQLSDKTLAIEHPLPSRDEMRGLTVEQIREQIRVIDAEGQKMKTQLEGRIQNLLAIGHEEAAPAFVDVPMHSTPFDDSDWPV